MGARLLDIKNLTVSFDKENKSFTAVKDLCLNVNRGEIRALVGESGSGKSVTSMSILQLIPSPPASYKNGSILFYEKSGVPLDLLQISASEMASIRGSKIAMIFQEPMTALNPLFTIGNQIVFTVEANFCIRCGPAAIGACRGFSPGAMQEGRHSMTASQFAL